MRMAINKPHHKGNNFGSTGETQETENIDMTHVLTAPPSLPLPRRGLIDLPSFPANQLF